MTWNFTIAESMRIPWVNLSNLLNQMEELGFPLISKGGRYKMIKKLEVKELREILHKNLNLPRSLTLQGNHTTLLQAPSSVSANTIQA